MRLKKMSELVGEGVSPNTLLHLSENVKFFALHLEAGRTKECGCGGTPPEVLFQVIEGSGTIRLDDEPFVLQTGDLLLCPYGKTHRLAADQGTAFGLLVVKPLKQD